MKHYSIHECFHSFQGEGVHMGRSAFFIRTYGCPIQCPWCDSLGTWHKDYKPEHVHKLSPEDLRGMALASKAEFAVITGGEATIFDLAPITQCFHQAGLKVHLETSGAFPIKGHFDWITLSPKWQKKPLDENLMMANEIKIIVENATSINLWWDNIHHLVQTQHVWLHPEWSQRRNQTLLNTITQWVKQYGAPFRAGYQIHKPYLADSLDPNAKEDLLLVGKSPTRAV